MQGFEHHETPAHSVAQGCAISATRQVRIRHYPRDGSVFLDDDYLVRGVAGGILVRLVREYLATGRQDFSTRELRLAGTELRLPDLHDNLSVRLGLLQQRLHERSAPLQLARTGRGRFRLQVRECMALSLTRVA